jgi:UDP-glucose 4-epimerase
VRVLVTGATGFLGCHLVAALRARDCSVRLLVRDPARLEHAFAPFGLRDLPHRVGDVTDPGAVDAALAEVDAVVHSAGLFSLDRRRAAELQRVNVEGSRLVLETAARRGLDPIVHVSSVSALFPPDGTRLTPDTAVKQPRDMYAHSKAEAERIARALQAAGHPVTIFYPGQIWGPRDPTLNDGVRTVMAFLEARTFPDVPGGIPIADVRDLAPALLATLEAGRGARRYLAGGRFLAVRQIARSVTGLTGRRNVCVPVPGAVMRGLGRAVDAIGFRPGFAAGLTHEAMQTLTRGVPCDDSRAAAELGFRPRPIEETLRDSLLWAVERDVLAPRHAGRLAGVPIPPWLPG